MKIPRRKFIEYSTKVSAAALLSGAVGTPAFLSDSGKEDDGNNAKSHPNILLLLVDQQRIPPEGYRSDEGVVPGIREILGFQALSRGNPFTRFFPGYLRLRKNGVILRTHYTASAACVPSRACIMTGSYSTGVDDTDQLFKAPEDVTWLDPNGTPTIGDWFQAAGYSTHYFGKWHVSHSESPDDYLKPWGFSDWGKNSYPEPHGSDPNNAGTYRDVGFADDMVAFFSEKGKTGQPWLAVGSLVNPHDFGLYPVGWQLPDTINHGIVPWTWTPLPPPLSPPFPPPPGISYQGEKSLPKYEDPESGLVVPLNPDGFPQNTYSLPPTFGESLDEKPRCQKEYAIKFGLAFAAPQKSAGLPTPYPFQLQGEYSTSWFLGSGDFYSYTHYLADLQLRRMLLALDDNNLTNNTIVVFLSDHGDLGGAHGGMIQKWHNAYEETVRVPMVISSPLVNKKEEMREVLQPTSSIDVAPTLLGLAGFNEQELRRRLKAIRGKEAKPFAGADLSSHIKGKSAGPIVGPDGRLRPGAFFMSNDMITENGKSGANDNAYYNFFLPSVEDAKNDGYPFLESGSVTQPNNVRALCTGDWKIVRYLDPDPNGEPDEWELYYLKNDPIEQTNLVDYKTGDVRYDVTVPGMTTEELGLKNEELKQELARQEALALGSTRQAHSVRSSKKEVA